MPIHSILEHLNNFSIFGGIGPNALLEVGDLFEAATYPAGSRIIQEGGRGNRLFILTSGRVQVSVRRSPTDESGDEVILATLEPGATFGEMEMLDTQTRSATVTVLEPSETVELTSMGLYQIFRRDPEIFRMMILNLARDLSRRLRAADQRLALARLDHDPE